MLTLHFVLVILTIVCLLLAAAGVAAGRCNLGWLGMFFWAMAVFVRP